MMPNHVDVFRTAKSIISIYAESLRNDKNSDSMSCPCPSGSLVLEKKVMYSFFEIFLQKEEMFILQIPKTMLLLLWIKHHYTRLPQLTRWLVSIQALVIPRARPVGSTQAYY